MITSILKQLKRYSIVISLGTISGILLLSIAVAKPIKKTPINSINTNSTTTKQLQRLGKFSVVYKPSNQPLYQELQAVLKETSFFEKIANGLNETNLVLRVDIPIILKDCGQVNAFYSPKDHTITICHEFMLSAVDDFEKSLKYSKEKATEAAVYATIFVFFHELGHALIDVLELPIVGQEEDVVDEFAAIMFLNNDTPDTDKVVLYGAMWFGSQPEGTFWDEHSSGDKRFFNLICLIYGSNPQKYAPIIEKIFANIVANEKVSPEDLKRRAQICEQEYPKKFANWNKLLLPHFAQGKVGWGNTNNTVPSPPPVNNNGGNGQIW